MCKCFIYKLKATFHFPTWPGNEAKILQLPSPRHSAIDQSYDLVFIGDGLHEPCNPLCENTVNCGKGEISCREINPYGILH